MAHFNDYPDDRTSVFMLEAQQRVLGTKSSGVAANGDTSAGEPSSPLVNIGGARLQYLPPSNHLNIQANDHQKHSSPHQLACNERHQHDSPVRNPSCSAINPIALYEDSLTSSHALAAASTAAAGKVNGANGSPDGVDDIRKCGYLRKQKHGHKRFFVLRASSHLGPSRLEYYDSEKKFRNSVRSAATACTTSASSSGTATTSPKRVIYLSQCFTVNKRADSKNKHLIALYTKDEYFAIVAENEQEQEEWYLALCEQMSEGKRGHFDTDDLDDGYGTVLPGTVFKEVWQVNVKPKGLGQSKNLTGVYRLCLSSKSLYLLKLNSETPCVNLPLMNIRRCGHSESFFFIEVGRSSSVGPGEIWMQVDDSVVAQSMHETILETMKALKAFAEFRPRSKSQSSGSNPMAFITTRRHLGNLPPSQTGLQRRSRTESIVGTPPSKSSAANGYRFRTSSEGEGTMTRPFRSVTGSLLHLNSARLNLGRQESVAATGGGAGGSGSGAGGRHVRAVVCSANHIRSASLPVSHFPSTSSPVSVSSSSGHGSVSETLTRPSSASLCGSPSDGGFNSSDEYGSSPGDMRYFRVRSNTPDSLGNTPPIREEHSLSDYMAMGWQQRDTPGDGALLRDDSAEDDRPGGAVRRRTPSFSRQLASSGGIAMYQKMTQTALSLDEVAGEGSLSSSLRSDYSSSSEHSQARGPPAPQSPSADEGYMPMMPGAGPAFQPLGDSDYMPMEPSTAALSPTLSPPARGNRQPLNKGEDAHGYMMMLPGAGQSSAQTPHLSSKATEPSSKNGEYMDMTLRTFNSSNDAHPISSVPDLPSASTPYFSLPRSFKAPVRQNASRDDYVPMSSPVKPATMSLDPSPHPPVYSVDPGAHNRAVRPTRLPLGHHSFHGARREGPSSPGEYINIQFAEHPPPTVFSSPTSASSSGNHEIQRRSNPPPNNQSEDYMSVHASEPRCPPQASRPSLVAPWNPPAYIRPVASGTSSLSDDYTDMTFGAREASGPTAAMMQHLCVLEPNCTPPTSQLTEPKVVRADPQGRRRHSSETFISPPPGPMGSSSVAAASSTSTHTSHQTGDGNHGRSSSSFDNVWMHIESSSTATRNHSGGELSIPPGVADMAEHSSPSLGGYMCHSAADTTHLSDLNYIALDLRGESARPTNPSDVPPLSPSAAEGAQPGNGAYASIDFKSEGFTDTSTE